MPRSMRPPESWSSVAAVIAVIAGVRPGIWKIAEPSRIFSVCAASQASTRGGVGAVGLGGPHGVEARGLGLLDQRELLLGGQAQAPVADVQAQSHASLLSSRRRRLEVADAAELEPPASSGRAPRITMRTRAAPHASCAPPSTACRCDTRRAMLDGMDANRIIVGAYTDRQGGDLPDAGRPPQRRAHRAGQLRARLGPLHRRRQRRRARPPSASCSTLRAMLEASIAIESGAPDELGHRRVPGPAPAAPEPGATPGSATARRSSAQPGWAWLRPFRRLDEYERASRRAGGRAQGELQRAARSAHLIAGPDELDLRHDARGRGRQQEADRLGDVLAAGSSRPWAPDPRPSRSSPCPRSRGRGR